MPCFGAPPVPASSPPPGAEAERRVHVVQGEFHVTGDPGVVLTTILGSCVAACLRDPNRDGQPECTQSLPRLGQPVTGIEPSSQAISPG